MFDCDWKIPGMHDPTDIAANGLLCNGSKRCYPSIARARRGARGIFALDECCDVLYIYPCPYCGWYHLTSEKGGDQANHKIRVVRNKKVGRSHAALGKQIYKNRRVRKIARQRKESALWRQNRKPKHLRK